MVTQETIGAAAATGTVETGMEEVAAVEIAAVEVAMAIPELKALRATR